MTYVHCRDEIIEAGEAGDYDYVNQLLNKALKDDEIPSDKYPSLCSHAIKTGFSFGKHWDLVSTI